MGKKANELLKKISIEHEESKLQLEEHEKELRAREARNESEQKKLDNEKKMVLTTYHMFFFFLLIFSISFTWSDSCLHFAEWIGDFGAEESRWENVEIGGWS